MGEAEFLNVDLDVRSRWPLAPLAAAWPWAQQPLHADGRHNSRWLIFSSHGKAKTADATARQLNTVRLRLCLFVVVAVCSLGVARERPQDDELRVTLERRFAAPAFAVVRDAERVEALPVEETGAGLSAPHRVVERPVPLDPATARDMRRTVLSTKSYVGGPMACLFQPGLALRFHKGRESLQVLVCFLCGELVFEKPGGEWLDGKLTFSETVRPGLGLDAREAGEPRNWSMGRLN